jgi:hypothetical protein
MGTKLKRGKAGNAVQYLTRNQAIKKLQLRLSEFRWAGQRKLCAAAEKTVADNSSDGSSNSSGRRPAMQPAAATGTQPARCAVW